VVFVCRNNGFAISTPVAEQYRGDGIGARGVAYGMHTLRVDGNDVFAVYNTMAKAREIANSGNTQAAEPTLSASGACVDAPGVNSPTRPVLVEAMTYREGHHSTSDDSTRYRKPEEIQTWRETANPVMRLRRYMTHKGWWDESKEKALLAAERKAVLVAMTAAEAKPKPDVQELFTDVYAGPALPQHLEEQYREMREHTAKYADHYAQGGH
jgi:2-oxoisovalerate dehydrogenase E1 component alpha subunit